MLTDEKMPPQGESVGFALEDVVLFSRILKQCKDLPIEGLFAKYEHLCRPRINAAVKAANLGVETVKDHSWFWTWFIEIATWIVGSHMSLSLGRS